MKAKINKFKSIIVSITMLGSILFSFAAHSEKKDWESVIETMCTKPTEEDLKRPDCEKYFTECVIKLQEMPKAEEDKLTKFNIAYELYQDEKVRKFACKRVMK